MSDYKELIAEEQGVELWDEIEIEKEIPLILVIKFISGYDLVLGGKFDYKKDDNEFLEFVYNFIYACDDRKISFSFHGSTYVLIRDFIVMAELKEDLR